MPAPTITIVTPSGAGSEEPVFTILIELTDDVQVVQNTIDVWVDDGAGDLRNYVVNGVVQAGVVGTITPNAGNGFDVELTQYFPLTNTIWGISCYAEDNLAAPTTTTTPFLVGLYPLSVEVVEPEGVQIGQPTKIDVMISDEYGGLDAATAIDLSLSCSDGSLDVDVIVAGVFQTGFDGYIDEYYADPVTPQLYNLHVVVTGFPDFVTGRIYTFNLDCSTLRGVSL